MTALFLPEPLTTTRPPGLGGGGGVFKWIRGKGGRPPGCGGGGGKCICASATVNVHTVIAAITNVLMIFIVLKVSVS